MGWVGAERKLEELEKLQMENKRSEAILKRMDILDKLAERLQAKAQQEAMQDPGAAAGMETVPNGGLPEVRSSAPQPGTITPDLLSELVPLMIQGGDFGAIVDIYKNQNPKEIQILDRFLGGPVNLRPGQSSGGGIGDIIRGAGEPGAMEAALALKMAGVDITPLMNAQVGADRLAWDKAKGAHGMAIDEANLNLNQAKVMSDIGEVTWRKETEDEVEYEVPYLKNGERAPIPKRRIGETKERTELQRGKEQVSVNLDTIATHYINLDKAGGIVNVEKGPVKNMLATLKSSAAGQRTAAAFGLEEQSMRNTIRALQPALINAIRKASQMGARGLDTERELDFYMRMATDLSGDIQSNLAAIAILDDAYGDGSITKRLLKLGDKSLVRRINEAMSQRKATAKSGSGELPAEARAKLVEGEVTTFANGQAWTLKGGVPVKVK